MNKRRTVRTYEGHGHSFERKDMTQEEILDFLCIDEFGRRAVFWCDNVRYGVKAFNHDDGARELFVIFDNGGDLASSLFTAKGFEVEAVELFFVLTR